MVTNDKDLTEWINEVEFDAAERATDKFPDTADDLKWTEAYKRFVARAIARECVRIADATADQYVYADDARTMAMKACPRTAQGIADAIRERFGIEKE